jgi:4-hydroxybenzoate polyprenyltransferase
MTQETPLTLAKDKNKMSVKDKNTISLILTAMRPHQWVKNLFIFAPLLFGRKLTDLSAIGYSLMAFSIFCMLASALYIFNDWIDAEDDRNHPEKCNRPISSGALSVPVALISSLVLAIIGFGLASLISFYFFIIAALYVMLTLSYCLTLKKLIVLDAMAIAAGFVVRIVGGAIAVSVMPSHWLIVCAYLLALFLAFTKRRQELLTLSQKAGDHREVLNEYSLEFLEKVNNILIGASIVCYALYTVAPETIEKFNTDNLIYGTVFVIYGMFRYMILIQNPSNGGNPSKMLLQDKPLLLTVISWVIYNAFMIYYLKIESLWTNLIG